MKFCAIFSVSRRPVIFVTNLKCNIFVILMLFKLLSLKVEIYVVFISVYIYILTSKWFILGNKNLIKLSDFFHEWSNCCFVRQGLIGEPRGSLLNESNVFYGLFRSSYFKFSRIMELSVQLGSAKTLEKYSTTARPVHLTSEQIETLQSFDPNSSTFIESGYCWDSREGFWILIIEIAFLMSFYQLKWSR